MGFQCHQLRLKEGGVEVPDHHLCLLQHLQLANPRLHQVEGGVAGVEVAVAGAELHLTTVPWKLPRKQVNLELQDGQSKYWTDP